MQAETAAAADGVPGESCAATPADDTASEEEQGGDSGESGASDRPRLSLWNRNER
eukprot:SAG22_NODE_7581_length_727_cov_0.783439_1_plen_54_part_10